MPGNKQEVSKASVRLLSRALDSLDSHLSHVSLRGEDHCLQPVVRHRQTLLLHHLLQPGQDLSVRQFGVPQHRAARLDRLDDLI